VASTTAFADGAKATFTSTASTDSTRQSACSLDARATIAGASYPIAGERRRRCLSIEPTCGARSTLSVHLQNESVTLDIESPMPRRKN